MAFFRNVVARAAVLLIVLGIIGALSGCAKKEYSCTDGTAYYMYYPDTIITNKTICMNIKSEVVDTNRQCFDKKTQCELIQR